MVRTLLIIQLCFAFMMLAWYACFPFTGELYHFRSRLFLTQTVRGEKALLAYVPESEREKTNEKLNLNAALFHKLPGYQQNEVTSDTRHYQKKLKSPFRRKIRSAFEILIWKLPLFKLSWMVFALLISFAILFRISGAVVTVWILPLLSLCYLLDNHFLERDRPPPDAFLFPKIEQHNFQEEWDAYLTDQWSPSRQVDEGEFYFNLARLKALREDVSYGSAFQFRGREPLAFLFLYFAWNLLFAYIIYKKEGAYDNATQQHFVDRPHHPI